MHKVKNLKGTSNHRPKGYDSWLDFWEKKTGNKAKDCHKRVCHNNTDLVGAHVKLGDKNDLKRYIVPLCRGCNVYHKTHQFLVRGKLVPVNSKNEILK